MSPSKRVVAALLASSVGWVLVQAGAAEPDRAHPAAASHGMVRRQRDLTWGPPPEGLPPGAKATLLQGDPSSTTDTFTVRLRAGEGYTIPPHTHPTSEHLTVIAGTLLVGDGDVIDRTHVTALGPGDFAEMPAGHHHYAIWGAPGTIVQVHALGPWGITYVDPADDPRNVRAVSAPAR